MAAAISSRSAAPDSIAGVIPGRSLCGCTAGPAPPPAGCPRPWGCGAVPLQSADGDVGHGAALAPGRNLLGAAHPAANRLNRRTGGRERIDDHLSRPRTLAEGPSFWHADGGMTDTGSRARTPRTSPPHHPHGLARLAGQNSSFRRLGWSRRRRPVPPGERFCAYYQVAPPSSDLANHRVVPL